MKKSGNKKLPVFDLDNCIRCYCCQEHCPQGAIESRPQILNSWLSKLVKLFRR
jgi:formate hydrogenlyase subunit 6/NADH:ubiquinone oxidoreductase subunit I